MGKILRWLQERIKRWTKTATPVLIILSRVRDKMIKTGVLQIPNKVEATLERRKTRLELWIPWESEQNLRDNNF